MEGREVKIAIIVAIIMITICLIVFVTVNSKEQINNIDLKVFKLYEIIDSEGNTKYQYRPCTVSTDDQITIYKEVAQALKLTDEQLLTGKQIKGNFKVELNGKMVAFDANDDDMVYLKDTERLYEFKSIMYEKVKKACEQ